MDQQNFIGEHLLPGQLGYLSVVLSFVTALFSAYAYYRASLNENTVLNDPWKKLARWGFGLHAIAVAGIFIALYYIISHHLFEYHYAWKHSSRGLKVKYLLSCFWEGSEGSFLLWMIWHAVLGLILMRTGKIWENRVMAILTLVQAILGTMLLGIHLGNDINIGSNPFVLLRNKMADAPVFSQPNYLEFIKDGNGLNILLQNYWMVIHPPVLFLGFALTLVPFAYSIAALWKGEYKSWIKPALQWSLISGGILGMGIMMGGAWAYESLNFGGYWAWDPVENASLVPWLTLIAGLHTLVIYKSTGRSLKVTLIFFILTYLLIWYSTFLTRTGILGETSVHAFTGEDGSLFWHLLITIGMYLAISTYALVRNWKKMPRVAGEEETNTREFWMLIGSVFLLIGALQIILTTSMPVWSPLYKLITGTDIAPAPDPVRFYNDIQVWVAVFVSILTASIQFLKYKKTGMKAVWSIWIVLSLISLALAAALVWGQKIEHKQYMVFTFAIFFTLVGNLYYLITTQKLKLMKAGGSITHIGFGLMLLGILLSGYKKQVISIDRTNAMQNWDFGKETFEENFKESRENVLIFRNTTLPMGPYMVTYLGDSTINSDPPLTYYKVKYERMDRETGDIKETFYLHPEVYINPKGQDGLSPNPDFRSYWSHDVFTYITSISKPGSETDTSEFRPYTVKKGDSIFLASGYLVFEGLSSNVTNKNYRKGKKEEVAVEAQMTAYSMSGKLGQLNPVYAIDGNDVVTIPDTMRDLGISIMVNKIIPEQDAVEMGIRQRAQQDDWIVMKAIVFPYIRILWTGIIVMCLGFFVSWWSRRK